MDTNIPQAPGPGWVKIAAEIIAKTSRDRPADAALRATLKTTKKLTRMDSREISRRVFAYYRWLQWIDSQAPVEKKIARAMELARKFQENPTALPIASLQQAVPAWACEQLQATPEWLRTLQSEPKLWLRAKKSTASNMTNAIFGLEPGPLPNSFLHLGEADLFRSPEFHEGQFELQDICSQAIGWICYPQPGETWWDACTGEGGKTLHFSDLMQNKGLIWSTDKADWRLRQLKLRASRAGCFNYRSRVWEGRGTLPTKTRFDGVLLDAPCSGLGTWQRNPHARWTTSAHDVQELAALQLDLLSQTVPALKPGGRLIYAVCTLTNAETTGVVDAFNAAHPEMEPLPFANPLTREQVGNGRLFLWPQNTGGNGMFVAVWHKR